LKTWPIAAATLCACQAASAQDVILKPLVDVRVRSEHVDQDELPRNADAVTARMRSGVQADAGPLQLLVEAEATLGIVNRFNDGLNGRAGYPVVPDPANVELNRAQLRYLSGKLAATAGRQLLELSDQRFVGSQTWRQNQQTFDAVHVTWGDPKRVFTDLSYAWSNRTTNGINGIGARQQAISGNNVFALAGVATPVGTVTGFAYLVDQDKAVVQGFRLSSQTYGVRLAGTYRLGNVGVAYSGSWARQGDWHRNPNDFGANYWLAEATVSKGLASATLGHEVLGADDGRPLTSVQTPLGSVFRFQGWAGKFVTTPPNGVRDLYVSGALNWKVLGPFAGANLQAVWHRFRSDRLEQHYGTELDLLAGVKQGHTSLSARFARYRANAFATNTSKFWLEVDWAL
jgi:hypothetical protein